MYVSKSTRSSTGDAELFRQAREGDVQARNALVRKHLGLAHRIVRAYQRCADPDDLMQVAVLGMMRAIETYDPERAAFSTYSFCWMRSEITRYLARNSCMHTRDRAVSVLSLDAPVGDEGDSWGDRLADGRPLPDDIASEHEASARLHGAVDQLDNRTRAMLRERLAGWTLAKVGTAHGISRERVRQLQDLALPAIRRAFATNTCIPNSEP